MQNPEKARRQVDEWKGLLDRARAILDDLLTRRREGEYLPAPSFARLRALQKAIGKAHKARDHKARIRTLTAALGA